MCVSPLEGKTIYTFLVAVEGIALLIGACSTPGFSGADVKCSHVRHIGPMVFNQHAIPFDNSCADVPPA